MSATTYFSGLDPDDLSDRLQTSLRYVRLNRTEREFLADLIQAHVRDRGRKEIADQKAIAVAQHVIWLEEFHDVKTEAAIADAERRFGLKRTRITDILKEQRPKWDSLRSSAHDPAVRQAYALIEEHRAFIEEQRAFGYVEADFSDSRQSYARLLEEVTELAMLEKKDEVMKAELAALAEQSLARRAAQQASLSVTKSIAVDELVDIR
jgi:hypothetical protein